MTTREIACKELVELVTDYFEDRLDPETRILFEEHVAYCAWCQTYLDQMRDTIRVSGTLREEDLSPEARDALMTVFRDWKAER
jgi:hypothetical protein